MAAFRCNTAQIVMALGVLARGVSTADCLDALRAHATLVSSLAPVPCRDDLAGMAQRHFFQTGHAVEIGVLRGEFAAKNLLHWQGNYTAIDAWAYRPADPLDKNFQDERKNEQNKHAAWSRMLKSANGEPGRIAQIQALSQDGAKLFNDSHFDWIYLDALHTLEALRADLRAWWPKLRTGGLLSGDDYGDQVDTEYVTRTRYPEMLRKPGLGGIPYAPANNWGVVRALDAFARETRATLHVTWSLDCYLFPAWYMVKPPDCIVAAAGAGDTRPRSTP